MRAISLVDRLEFDFAGNVLRNAITLQDVDNDGNFELIVANEKGDVTIFKGGDKWQTIHGLGFVSCVAVGDIFNQGRNSLVIVTGDGWCYIYGNSPEEPEETLAVETSEELEDSVSATDVDTVDGQILSGETVESTTSSSDPPTVKSPNKKKPIDKTLLQKVHVQRIPANAKYILLDDIDGDGFIEMVLGLTDRVVRSYRWFDPSRQPKDSDDSSDGKEDDKEMTSKLVGLNKWECAKQIGSVTMHCDADNRPSLLIAQPGGTFMRIRYQTEENVELSDSSDSLSEFLTGSSIDYQFLGLSRMRNQNISTEIVGNLQTKRRNDAKSAPKGTPYAVATLDGTIMLVQDEIILWALAVDHQIFALTKLDITGNGVDDLVACSWDGHTYILDQEKHAVRFQLGESVQAFASGLYSLEPGEPPVTCLVYVTFHNKILVYYDIPLKTITCKRFSVNVSDVLDVLAGADVAAKTSVAESLDVNDKRKLVEYLLYRVRS